MKPLEDEDSNIVTIRPLPEGIKSNVIVCSNVFPRLPDVPRPERDVAFRSRVRGSVALHLIVPPGIIDNVTNHHEIRSITNTQREAALEGTLTDTSFALLPEQVKELSPFTCTWCGRSTVSYWFENGCVQQKFVEQCMCRRPKGQEQEQ